MAVKIAQLRLPDEIARRLEQRILEGSLKPGDRLAPERELAEEMGVSRSSLREAIQKLASRGLLSCRQGEGNFVTDRLDAGFADAWASMLEQHPAVREDLLEFRHLLEAKAAECAARRATEADRERLCLCHERLQEAYAGDDLSIQVERDVAFHQAIAEAAHNVIIGHLSGALLRLSLEQIRLNLSELRRLPESMVRLRDQHRRIWAAIDAGCPEDARVAATEHIDFVRQQISDIERAEARRESAQRRLRDV
jgi:GntR family transcriptional repressor for pyruvate dehydrogenase complex